MKKVLFFAVALITLSGVAQAQDYKPTKGTFATEINFDPFGAIGAPAELPEFGVKGRYFISDNLAVRASLDFGFASTTRHEFSGNPEVEQISKSSAFNFGLAPGIEYHFGNWEKTSLYCGAEIGFGILTQSSSIENENFQAVNVETSGPSVTTFRFNVLTGFDYYFTKNIFVGVELGLGLETSSTGETEITRTGQPTTTDKDYNSSFGFGFYCDPAIRLGWKF